MFRSDGLTSREPSTPTRPPEVDRRQQTIDEMHRDRRQMQRTQWENHERCSPEAGLASNKENPERLSAVEGTI
jgi:hypothetical protein